MNSENEKNEQVFETDNTDAVQLEDAMGNFEAADDYMEAAQQEVAQPGEISDEAVSSVEDALADESVYEASAEMSEEPKNYMFQTPDEDDLISPLENESRKVENLPETPIREKAEEQSEISAPEPVQEKVATEQEMQDRSAIVAEFAPEPINIPKYNREKEQKRAVKESEKNEKRNSRKNKERHEKIYRFVFVARTILLFILMVSVASGMLFSLLVKMSTSKYSVERTITNNEPGRFIVGKIPAEAREELNLVESSPRASVMDIIRDNKMSDRTVTYYDIELQISKSLYPKFISEIASDIIDCYLYGDKYEGITEDNIAGLIEESAGRIETLTGQSLGSSGSRTLASYISKSEAFKEISVEAVEAQKINHDTKTTSFLFSTMTLIILVVAMILMIILAIAACKGFAHKMIGWSIALAGLIVGILGYFVGPLFESSNEFIKCVIDVLVTEFNKSALIWGGISAFLGVVVIILGKAMHENEKDDDDEDYFDEEEYYEEDDEYEDMDEEMDEDDYIDEIEQVSTAQ